MLFLFENTLTHYIYSILYLDKPGAPSPRSEQLHAMSNHAPNGIRAHNLNRFREADGRTIVPGWNASHPEPCAHGASRTPSPLL